MPNEKLRILYAEDEADIREIAKIALENMAGYVVQFCLNGREVLDEIEIFKPDIILLDVMMPVMDGPTVLRELQKKGLCNAIPVVFVTAKIQSVEVSTYKTMGVTDVIRKPFDPMTLAETIKDCWERYHGESDTRETSSPVR